MCVSISIFLYIYNYLYIYIHICTYTYRYIHMYIHSIEKYDLKFENSSWGYSANICQFQLFENERVFWVITLYSKTLDLESSKTLVRSTIIYGEPINVPHRKELYRFDESAKWKKENTIPTSGFCDSEEHIPGRDYVLILVLQKWK